MCMGVRRDDEGAAGGRGRASRGGERREEREERVERSRELKKRAGGRASFS